MASYVAVTNLAVTCVDVQALRARVDALGVAVGNKGRAGGSAAGGSGGGSSGMHGAAGGAAVKTGGGAAGEGLELVLRKLEALEGQLTLVRTAASRLAVQASVIAVVLVQHKHTIAVELLALM